MRVDVTYHVRDVYNIPDEKWQEAMDSCDNDEDDAFNSLIDEAGDMLCKSDVTDRYVRAEEE